MLKSTYKLFHEQLPFEYASIAKQYLGDKMYWPDLIIAPDGNPYLYRWYLTPRLPEFGSVYFHLQVASDPERPLHDHPWDNQSVILLGGYEEVLQDFPPSSQVFTYPRKKGDVIFRRAELAHRLILPPDYPATLTLFSTGPKRREWGFWYPEGWKPFAEVTTLENGVSVYKGLAEKRHAETERRDRDANDGNHSEAPKLVGLDTGLPFPRV